MTDIEKMDLRLMPEEEALYLAREDGEAICSLLTEELEKLPKRKK